MKKRFREWQKTNKPVVERALKEQETVVLAEDEMILSTQTILQKIWLPKGENPKIEVSHKKENRSIYGFLNIKTGQEHAFKTQKQNMFITTEILKKVRKIYPDQELLLFWDGAGWHRGSEVQEFIQGDGNVETVYFPRYAPEENPQEYVWKNGRSKTTHNEFIKDIDISTNKFIDYLNNTNFNYSLLGFKTKSN
jgi:transposase